MKTKKKMVTKIEINMEQVLLYSKATVKFGPDAGKLVLARNLECIKNGLMRKFRKFSMPMGI